MWSVVHVKDLGHAYMILLTHIKNSKPEVLLQNPYYFAENGSEMSMGEAAEHIGRTLYDIGRIQTPQAQTFSEAHFQDVLGPRTPAGLGCNSRSRAIRLRDLGWEPENSIDIWTSWKEDEISSMLASLDSV